MLVRFYTGLQSLIRDERGVTAIEYGLIAALIALGIIGAVTALSGGLQAKFQAITAAL